MAKRALKLSVRIPPYRPPRNAWRRALSASVLRQQRISGVHYEESDQLEIGIRLYMDASAVVSHDVDNRLKDILDALQGRAGGSKREPTLPPVIPNDRQVYRVVIEKSSPPPQSRGLGHLTIRRLSR